MGSNGEYPRIKGKGKGKESLVRYEGEAFEGEPEIVLQDPRKAPGFKRSANLRPYRTDLHEVKYEVGVLKLPHESIVLIVGNL